MKNKWKSTALLVMSATSLIATVGYSSWIVPSQWQYSINNRDTVSKPVAYIVGKEKIKYTSIEKALGIAKSGDIVCVIAPEKDNYHPTDNKVKPDKATYEITRNCTVKEGVTLVLPTDKKTISTVTSQKTLNTYITSMKEDDRSHGETTKNSYDTKASYSKHATDFEENYLRVTVKIREGVSLTNQGTIVVSGYLSGGAAAGPGVRGQTSHSYAQFILEKNASIIQNGSKSTFHCYGYVKEDTKNNGSKVKFTSGTIYMPLIVNDYKGFQFLSGIQDAVQKQGCSPFNNLEMRNFMCNVSFGYGTSLFGVTNIYYYQSAGTLGTYEDTIHSDFKIIGNTADALINLTDGRYSSVDACFDIVSHKMKINLIGGANIGNLAFKISAGGVGSIDLNTKYGFFPIHYGVELELSKAVGQSLASFNATSQKLKLLTGSFLTIHDGCTLTGSELAVLSAFVDGYQGQRDDAKWSAGDFYPLKEGAVCVLEENAFLSMDKLGGVVYCNQETNVTYQSGSVSVNEGWNQKQSGLQYVTKDFLGLTETACVKSIAWMNKKKMFVGMNNLFDPSNTSSSFSPHLAVVTDSEEIDFNGTQGVVFLDAISDEKAKLVANISEIKQSIQRENGSYPSMTKYLLGNISSTQNAIICGINSSVSISSNNAGVNEFEVQQITVKSLTNKVNGKDPLYIDGNIYLAAEVSNANQAYDKNIVWASLNESIATIDQSGKVTGKALGKVTLSATCGGKTAFYDTEVIGDSTKIGISDAWIVDSKNNSSKTTKDYSKDLDRPGGYGTDKYPVWKYSATYKDSNGQTKFYLKYAPNDGVITKVTWSFSGSTKNYLLNYDGSKSTTNSLDDDGSLSTTVKWDGHTNVTPDGAVLKCTVEDITGNVTVVEFFIIHDSGLSCLVKGTKVLLLNGTEKNVEDITSDDDLLVFSHEKGKLGSSKLFYNYHQGEGNIVTAPILKLLFENGSSVEIHVDHGFYDCSKMRYFYINKDNYQNYVGDEFAYITSSGKMGRTRLLGGEVKNKTVEVYSPVSVYHLNIFANGLLSITGEIEGWFNYFERDDNLCYCKEQMEQDIEKFGLYEYDDFKEYIRREIFDLLPIPFLKVSVGKGLTTKEKIISVMKRYLSFM